MRRQLDRREWEDLRTIARDHQVPGAGTTSSAPVWPPLLKGKWHWRGSGGAAWRDSLGPGACDGDKTIWGRGRALAGQSWVRVPAGARGYLPTVDPTSRVRWEKLVICFATRFSWRRHQVANQRLTVA